MSLFAVQIIPKINMIAMYVCLNYTFYIINAYMQGVVFNILFLYSSRCSNFSCMYIGTAAFLCNYPM